MNVKTSKFKPVFSTYVEVFPNWLAGEPSYLRFLHVCGGVSPFQASGRRRGWFSPRMWRCFYERRESALIASVFSTYVEVFL